MQITRNFNINYLSDKNKEKKCNKSMSNIKINESKHYQNQKIFFGTASINEKLAESAESGGKKLLKGAFAKLNGYFSTNTSSIFKEGSDSFEEISRNATRARQNIDDDIFTLRKTHHKTLIDGREQIEKERILRSKECKVEELTENAEEAQKIVKQTAEELKKYDPARDIARLQHSNGVNVKQARFDNLKGFSRIAGYEEEKTVLDKFFIEKIKNEKAGQESNVPGSVLFFGPTGNGKTTFAKAFADETGCERVQIKTCGSKKQKEEKFKTKLTALAKLAQERFNKDRTRTIIFVDEFDRVADKQSSILDYLTSFLATCSKKYHCTVFAATNDPLKLGLSMSQQTNFPYRISLNPPNQTNTIKVLKHYLENKSSGHIDYKILANELGKNNGVFSNSQIREICINGEEEFPSQEYLLNRIKDRTPTIAQEALDKFKKEEDVLITNRVSL